MTQQEFLAESPLLASLKLRVSAKCRRIQLRAAPAGYIELVYPPYASLDDAYAFARRNTEWILRTGAKIKKRPDAAAVMKMPESLDLKFLGQRLSFEYSFLESVPWTGVREKTDSVLLVSGRTADVPSCLASLRDWLIRKAERSLLIYAEELAEEYSFHVSSFRTGLQKRSWGTCTRKGVITLNAALLFMDEKYVRYVVIHELCHLCEMNHSRRFWDKVETFCPETKELRAGLNLAARELPPWLYRK